MCTHTNTHTNTHIYTYIRTVRTYIHTYIIYIHTYIHKYIHTHTHIHTYTNTYAHARTHTHTQITDRRVYCGGKTDDLSTCPKFESLIYLWFSSVPPSKCRHYFHQATAVSFHIRFNLPCTSHPTTDAAHIEVSDSVLEQKSISMHIHL